MKTTLNCVKLAKEQLDVYEEEKKKIQTAIAWKEAPEEKARLDEVSDKIDLTKRFLEMLKSDLEPFWDHVDDHFCDRKTRDVNYQKIFKNVYYHGMPLYRAIMEAGEDTEAENAIRMAFDRCIDRYNNMKDRKK